MLNEYFVLLEFFAFSFFQITSDSVLLGISLAQGATETIDTIFGDNESSRSISAFVNAILAEITQDGHEKDHT